MIFKTFNNDIDKVSAKWGVFGRSFNDIGTAIGNKISDINKNFQVTDDLIGAIKNSGEGILSRLYPSKESIQSQMLDVDALYPEMDTSQFSTLLKTLQEQQALVDSTSVTWNDYFKNLSEGEKWQIEFVQTTDLQKASLYDVKKGYENARKGAVEYNAQLKQQTLGAKAADAALKGLALAGNMLASMAISWVVGEIFKYVDNLIHAAEKTQQKAEELISTFESTLDTLDNQQKFLEENADRYEELSKGVNNLGENVSLTTEEYKEYNSLVNKIADMFPTMIQGYTDEGNAILTLKGNVDKLRDAYKEAQQEAYNLLIVSGEDGDGNDIVKAWNNLNNLDFLGALFDLGAADIGGDITTIEALEQLQEIQALSFEEYNEIRRIQEGGRKEGDRIRSELTDLEEKLGTSTYLRKAIGLTNNMSEEDFNAAKLQAKALVQTYQAQIETSLQQVQTLANAYLMTNEDYQNLDESAKTIASLLVNSIDENIANTFKTKADVGKYVIEVIDKIKDNPKVQNALTNLFEKDFSNMSIKDANNIIDEYIAQIAEILDEDEDKLKIRLGFDGYEELEDNYRSIVNKFARQQSGYSIIQALVQDTNSEEYTKYAAMVQKIDEFASQYSINTQDEIAAFSKALEQSNGDIEKAFEYYLALLEKEEPKNVLGISKTIENLNTKLKPVIDSLADAYQNIFLEDGSFTLENVGVDMLNSVKESIAEINEISGINIETSTFEDFVKVLADTESTAEDVHTAFNVLVSDIIKGTDTAEISAENYDVLVQSLEQMGITNAREELSTLKTVQDQLIAQGDKLEELTADQVAELYNEAKASALATQHLRVYVLQKQLANNPLSTEEDVQELENLITALGLTADLAPQLSVIRNAISMIELKSTTGLGEPIEASMSKIESAKQQIQKLIDEGFEFTFDFDGTGKNKDEEQAKETIDWVEIHLTRLQTKIDEFGRKVASVWDSWANRNSALKLQMASVRKEITDQGKAYDAYLAKANSINLSKSLKEKVRLGAFDIKDYDGEKAELINEYQQWWEKAQDALREKGVLKDTLASLVQTEFDSISTKFDLEINLVTQEQDYINNLINQTEAQGHLVSQAYYKSLRSLEETNLSKLQAEYTDLQKRLQSALDSKDIELYSEQWYEMTGDINAVSLAIQESTTALLEYDKTMRQLDWDAFDLGQEYASQLQEESDFLTELMSSGKLFDDKGAMTNLGEATLGLHAVDYNSYLRYAQEYAEELLEIEKELAKDPYDTELIARKQELLGLQRDNILAAQDEKQAMKDLIAEGYDALKESLQEIIDKRKEELQAEKDLYDYQKSIVEQTKAVAQYQKQLNAYAGDTSEESQAKIQQIKVSLQEAEDKLAESEYDKWMSDQEQMLDILQSDTEEWINGRLDDLNGLVQGVIDATNANSDSIKKTLETEVSKVGGSLTTEMEAVWTKTADNNTIVNGYLSEGVPSSITSAATTLNTTLTNIYSLVATMAGLEDTSASNTSGSTGNLSGAGNSSSNTPTTPNTSESGTGSNGGSNDWGSWFIKKDFKGSDSQLNYQTSLVDRLKWKDFDSSFSARAQYYSAMGGSGTYTGSSAQNSWMVKQMKKNGFAEGGTIGSALAKSGEDGFVLARKGETILSLKQIEELRKAFVTIDPVITKISKMPNPNYSGISKHNTNIDNSFDITFSLPGVSNYEEFMSKMRSDKQFEKFVQQVSIGTALGQNSLSKFKY